ncbi:hypothetical protein [Bacillus sp. NTK034]|nr:hypothetical protein [Bacillus sp. NTK034]
MLHNLRFSFGPVQLAAVKLSASAGACAFLDPNVVFALNLGGV